ncbi:MAG: hypothetical protein LUE24_11225 [Lachnospiraceae bacterium]|nr:hypothetical protein [Lachnospiraceae bacterium]
MVWKSKSTIAIIALALLALLTFGIGAAVFGASGRTEFSGDGYILSAEASGDEESETVSTQLWFTGGTSWRASGGVVTFTDSTGTTAEAADDSFIHYEEGSIASVTDSAVMDLDEYTQGVILYYGLDLDDVVSMDGTLYYLGESSADAEASFENFLIKNSSSRYLIGSSIISLIRPSGQSSESIQSGFAEIEYLASDKSIVLLNDGTNAWQFLSADCYLELANGVRLDLSTGELYIPVQEEDESGGYAVSHSMSVYLDDIDVEVTVSTSSGSGSGLSSYPTYRFTVVNGEDGADGENGEDGVQGDTGEDGAEGEAGSSDNDGADGSDGSSGVSGAAGAAGASGGQMSGVTAATTVPVVTLTSWTINGYTLSFTAYMDEVSANSVVSGTSYIYLTDLDTGEVYTWSADEGNSEPTLDFSEDTSEGFTMSYNELVPGHQYRLNIEVTYELEDAEYTQTILSRTFMADEYGIAFELVDRDTDSLSFQLDTSNRLVDVDSVAVYVNGVYFTNVSADDLEASDGLIEIDLNELGDSYSGELANQSWDITFYPIFNMSSYNSEGVLTTTKLGEDMSISYSYTVSTLKNEPVVGGVSLTAYDSGYLMAEVLGEWDGDQYASPTDEDGTIESIRFELYTTYAGMLAGTDPVTTKSVTSGWVAYFEVSDEDDVSQSETVHTGSDYYYLRVWYTYNDGAKTVEACVWETHEHTEDVDSSSHTDGEVAWDMARLLSITSTSLSFTGDGTTYNTAEDAAVDTTGANSGVSFNAIEGTLTASITFGNSYIVSADHPMTLQISAEPDYYNTLEYNLVDNTRVARLDYSATASTDDTELGTYSELNILVDLTGLRADTTYMFTLYGYERTGSAGSYVYTRVSLGSVSVTTESEREITIGMTVVDTSGIGVSYLRLGESASLTNYYDTSTGEYDEDNYMAKTDAAYRTLYRIDFELYLSGTSTPIGYCTITDENTTDAEHSSLYEQFYGSNTYRTYANYHDEDESIIGILGVGEGFVYRFKDADGFEISYSSLTSGDYYIRAVAAWDYTKYRYDVWSDPEAGEEADAYSYYSYKSTEENYENRIYITNSDDSSYGYSESGKMTVETLPYKEPSDLQYDDGSYIKVEEILNSDLGAYNGDSSNNTLYSSFWNSDTVAGLKLTNKYTSDPSTPTKDFVYYGFSYTNWQTAEDAAKSFISPTDYSYVDTSGNTVEKELYDIKITYDMEANGATTVPEIWILFYYEDDLPYIINVAEPIYETDTNYKGVSYVYDLTSSGGPIIYFADASVFYRGQSYVFMYETTIEDYDWDGDGVVEEVFNYPEDYYKELLSSSGYYTTANAFCSDVISVYRQTPVVYSLLEGTANGSGYVTDTWDLYVDDPDGAIQWVTMLGAGDATNARLSMGSTYGGAWDLYSGDLDETVYFNFTDATSAGHSLNSKTGYWTDTESTKKSGYLDANDLKEIQEAVTDRKEVDGVISDRGTTLTVTGMDTDGGSYKLSADYILLDDVGYNASTSYTNIALVQHNYIAQNDYSDTSGDDSNTNDTRLTLSAAELQEDNNRIRIYLEAPETEQSSLSTSSPETDDYYLSEDYLNKATTIAAVLLTATVTPKDATDNSDDYELGTLWVAPTAPQTDSSGDYTDYRYYLEFSLSGFGSSNYSTGDTVRFSAEIYYLTGESVSTPGSSSNYYAIKYVNAIQQATLYGNSNKKTYRFARYMYTSSGSVIQSFTGAGYSYYRASVTLVSGASSVWTQRLTVSGGVFDSSRTQLSTVTLSNAEGYLVNRWTAIELMKTASYTENYEPYVTVGSAVPSLESLKATGGLYSVQLTATVENWNLVSYGDDENFHVYYLIYDNQNNLVAAMIGADITDGTLDVTFSLSIDTTYTIKVYYKTDEDGLDSSEDYFGSTVEQGTQYAAGTDGATKILSVLTGSTEDSFRTVLNGSSITATTNSKITISAVNLETLGVSDSYSEKTLTASVQISSALLSSELSSLQLCYSLERREEGSTDDSEWEAVICDSAMSSSTYGDSAMTWDEVGTVTTRTSPLASANAFALKYGPGSGTIQPGYEYRLKAAVYYTTDGGNVLDITDTAGSQYSTGTLSWSALDMGDDGTTLVRTTNASRGSTTISLTIRLTNPNYTSVDGYYFIRIAEYSETNGVGSWTVLENEGTTDYYNGDYNKAYQTGVTYKSVTFTNLSADTTYRIQFYSMMDIDYDGTLNVTTSLTDLLGSEGTDTGLNLDDVNLTTSGYIEAARSAWMGTSSSSYSSSSFEASDYMLVGYSSGLTTRSSGHDVTAGEYEDATEGSATLLTLHFSGAMNADQITRVVYTLGCDADGVDTSGWSAVTVNKGSVSLFSSSASTTGDGSSGSVYLTLDLSEADGDLSLSTPGKYTISLVTYTTDSEGNYVVADEYSQSFRILD